MTGVDEAVDKAAVVAAVPQTRSPGSWRLSRWLFFVSCVALFPCDPHYRLYR